MILHINTSKEWRGGEQQLLYLAEGLQAAKRVQTVLCQPQSPLEEKCKESGIPTFSLPMRGEWDFAAARQIRSFAKENKVSLLHTHTAHAHALALLAKNKELSFPLVVSRRVDFRPKMGFVSRWKYHSKKVNYFLAVSNTIRDILISSGISPERVITVYSGIDTKKYAKLPLSEKLRTEWGIDKKEVVITNIAALVDHKDQETLLRSIALIQTSVPFRVLIVGSGPLEKKLKNLATELKLEQKVIFTGFRTDIPEILSLTGIFTLTSKEEGLGTAILDAMSAGKPIVATRGGGIKEMLDDGKGALLSAIRDQSSLATHFTTLLENESLRQNFGTYNKNAVKRFSYSETVKKTLLIYYSLLGETFLN